MVPKPNGALGSDPRPAGRLRRARHRLVRRRRRRGRPGKTVAVVGDGAVGLEGIDGHLGYVGVNHDVLLTERECGTARRRWKDRLT